jgi:hypothetical protein
VDVVVIVGIVRDTVMVGLDTIFDDTILVLDTGMTVLDTDTVFEEFMSGVAANFEWFNSILVESK